jgi:hypothetical protein
MPLRLCGMFMAALLLMCSPSQLEARQTVSLSYELPEQVSLREPILAELLVRNTSAEPVEVDFGWGGVGNFECEVTRSGTTGLFRPERPPGLTMLGHVTVSPSATRPSMILLSSWCDFASEGAYQVLLRFRGTVRAATGSAVEVIRESRHALLVGPRNTSRLRARLQDLLATATSPIGGNWAVAGAAIASTRDPEAVPFLVRLAAEPRLAITAVYGLASVEGPQARNALENLSRTGTPEVANLARAALARRAR